MRVTKLLDQLQLSWSRNDSKSVLVSSLGKDELLQVAQCEDFESLYGNDDGTVLQLSSEVLTATQVTTFARFCSYYGILPVGVCIQQAKGAADIEDDKLVSQLKTYVVVDVSFDSTMLGLLAVCTDVLRLRIASATDWDRLVDYSADCLQGAIAIDVNEKCVIDAKAKRKKAVATANGQRNK